LCSPLAATLYSAAGVSCFYAPSLIRRLSAKWTIVVAYAVHLLYVAANFDSTGSFLVPAALAAGSLTGPLWTAQSTYLTTLALGSERTAQEAAVARFNGLCGDDSSAMTHRCDDSSVTSLSLGQKRQFHTTVLQRTVRRPDADQPDLGQPPVVGRPVRPQRNCPPVYPASR